MAGHRASLAPATGTEFSVLPAQNATGNWVKVVQRVPIRLAVQMPADAPPLRTGMSADVEIDTGHRRALGDLFDVGAAVRRDVTDFPPHHEASGRCPAQRAEGS